MSKYEIVQEIPYDSFDIEFIEYGPFFANINASQWWSGICESDILIVHGEGLTEKFENYVFPFLYFSRVAKDLNKDSWLVNFSMYESQPFIPLLKNFDYMACRDILTHDHLSSLGLKPVLSFDCCILEVGIQKYSRGEGEIALIRGRSPIDVSLLSGLRNHVKYNCCWQWDEGNSITLETMADYLFRINKADVVLSTSYHGNIIAFLSNVPFISLGKGNKKYTSTSIELLPKQGFDYTFGNLVTLMSDETRNKTSEYYGSILESLVERAKRNCI